MTAIETSAPHKSSVMKVQDLIILLLAEYWVAKLCLNFFIDVNRSCTSTRGNRAVFVGAGWKKKLNKEIRFYYFYMGQLKEGCTAILYKWGNAYNVGRGLSRYSGAGDYPLLQLYLAVGTSIFTTNNEPAPGTKYGRLFDICVSSQLYSTYFVGGNVNFATQKIKIQF